MEINRNHYFMIGIVMLLLGVQLRWVDSYVLNAEASEFVAKRWDQQPPPPQPVVSPQLLVTTPTPTTTTIKTIKPPTWIGWSFVSIGAVLILHSLAMKKPEG
jgi:hypothetical protein